MESNGYCPAEIQIPVPWGHVSGKDWGPSTGKPLLGMHGWQDNCGTFDLLAPLLPREWRLISIDLPGHGFSSHLPPGMFYDKLEDVATVRRVAKHFGWTKFSILGHSMGAGIGMLYACVFPGDIEKLILLDLIRPSTRPSSEHYLGARAAIETMMDMEAKMNGKSAPRYSVEEACNRLLKATGGELSPVAAKILLKRGSKPSDEDPCKVVYSRDPRLQTPSLHRFSHEQILQYGSKMRCETLVVRALESPKGTQSRVHPLELSKVAQNVKTYLSTHELEEEETMRVYKQNCKRFRYVQVSGTHFVHLNEPQVVSHHIASFLQAQALPEVNL